RKTDAGDNRRSIFRPKKRAICARCRGSERTAPAARAAPMRPRCSKNATIHRINRARTVAFRPNGFRKRLSLGGASCMITIARLLPLLDQLRVCQTLVCQALVKTYDLAPREPPF